MGVTGDSQSAPGGGITPRRGIDPEDMLDPEAIPRVPTPETDERLRIPEILRPRARLQPVSKNARGDSGFVGMAAAWAVALDFVFVVIAGCTAGYFLGQWKGNQALWVLGGMAFGLTLGIWRLIRRTQAEERAEKLRRQRESREVP